MSDGSDDRADELKDRIWIEAIENGTSSAVASLNRTLDDAIDRTSVWEWVADFLTIFSESNASVVAFYGRWRAEKSSSSQVALSFAKVFEARGLMKLCADAVARAQANATTDKDTIALAEFVRDKLQLPASALHILKQGVVTHPRAATVWDAIADTHRIANSDRQSAEASYLLFKRCRIHSGVEKAEIAWASFGQMLSELGNYRLADEAYRSALDIDPNYVWALNRSAGLLRSRFARYGEAEKLALRSVEVDPANAWSWYHLGYIYHYNLHRIPEALKAYHRAIEIDPDYTRVWELLAVLLAWETADLAGAEEAFKKAFLLGGASAYAYNHYGVFLREHTDRYADAEAALQKAAAMEPKEWSHRLALAVLYEKRFQRFTDARRLLLEAKALGAPVDDIDYRLAVLVQRHRRSLTASRK